MQYRAYLMENGQTYAAIDLACEDDNDAKNRRQISRMAAMSKFGRATVRWGS